MSSKFSGVEDEKLIDLVEKNAILYNVSHEHFKNSQMRNDAWNQIGLEISKTGKDCLKRWTTIKDYYVRTKKSGSTGSSALVKKRMERLTFLEGTNIVNRPTTLNASNQRSNDDFIDTDFENFETSTDFGDDDIPPTFSGRTIKKAKKNGNSSSTMVVQLLNKDRDLRHKDKMNAIHEIITATKEKTPYKLDAVDHFLQSIGETIKTFPPRKLCEVKLKIMHLVSEMEIQIHEETEKMAYTVVDSITKRE